LENRKLSSCSKLTIFDSRAATGFAFSFFVRMKRLL
jgi:hypothetical protein